MENKLPTNFHYVSKYAAFRSPERRLHASGDAWGPAQAQHLYMRAAFGESAILGGRIDRNLDRKNDKPIKTDIMAFARSFGIDKARDLLEKWIEHFMPIALDDLTKRSLLNILLDSAAKDDWSLDYEGVEDRVADCITQMLRLPEYQLT